MKKASELTLTGKSGFAAPAFSAMLLALLFASSVVSASSGRPIAGGPCLYQSYEGEAEIISIRPAPGQSGIYDVMFLFHPRDIIRQAFARTEGKPWPMIRRDFSRPTDDFLKRYDIKIGRRIPCMMKVITQGTCTPVLFDFPTLESNRAP